MVTFLLNGNRDLPARAFGEQRIVGAMELERGEMRLTEGISAQGAGLADQRVDDVPVIGAARIATARSLQNCAAAIAGQ